MPHRSDPRFLVLHGLRLKAVAGAATVAEAVGLDVHVVQRLLDQLAEEGLVVRREGLLPGWSLTPSGTIEHHRLAADELERAGARPTVEDGYQRFLVLNPGVLDACSRWQVRDVAGRLVRNDHADRRYDARVVDDLSSALDRVRPVGDELGDVLERFRPYAPQLDDALGRVRSGDGDYVTKPVIPSFHTVWFEMHEDLLVTLGRDRASEATA
jgi:hypothetical protein